VRLDDRVFLLLFLLYLWGGDERREDLKKELDWVLKNLLEGLQPPCSDGAIDNTMIATESNTEIEKKVSRLRKECKRFSDAKKKRKVWFTS
jgi:phage/plasmid-associated DNA primase